MPRRRQIQIFTMSFLDAITCGFGAVVLLYMVMSSLSGVKSIRKNDELAAEAYKLEEQVLVGYKNLVVLRNTLEKTSEEQTRASGRTVLVLDQLQRMREETSRYAGDSMARREHVNKLKADLRSLEEGTRRLEGGTTTTGPEGEQLRPFRGSGDRQYLTGIRLKGSRILILVDASASMLDETLVNVLRMRNLPDVEKLLARKWQRAVKTADWLSTQIPSQSNFQFYAFNVQPTVLVEGTDGQWLSGSDPRQLTAAIEALKRTVPREGTSLINAFSVAKRLNPAPDQIVIITDGLPTQGSTRPIRAAVDAEHRMKLFDQATEALPEKVPVSVILLPMEGDLPAPSRFWRLARETGGVFMMPTKDWP
jgi:Mg-chelatase subunit ChlD